MTKHPWLALVGAAALFDVAALYWLGSQGIIAQLETAIRMSCR